MGKNCQCGHYPTIIVPGIGQSKVELLDNEGKRLKLAWPLDIDSKYLLKKILPSALKMMVLRGDRGFTDVLYKELCRAFSPLAANTEGIPKANLKVVTYPNSVASCSEEDRGFIYRMVPMEQLSAVIGEDHLYFFAYHSFGQPYETAKDLDKFIQSVKQQTGHDKVNLVPVSLGGSISVAYFDAYGYKGDVNRVANFVPAINGTSIVADVIDDKLYLDEPKELFDFILDRKTAEKIISFMRLLPKDIDKKITRTAISALKDTVLINSPAMWAVVPRERYEKLRSKYLCDSKRDVLKAKTDRFYRAQKEYEKLFLLQKERGVEFFTICGFGKKLMPFVKSKHTNSDTVIDLVSASLGAKAAPYGEKLPLDYKANRQYCSDESHNHISPCRTVDASEGLFPDTTWYFSGQVHDDIAYHDVALTLCCEILSNKEFKNVYSNPLYPQFNGSRNIKEIKYKLMPKAKRLLETPLESSIKEKLLKAVAKCDELFANTIVKDNTLTKEAAKQLELAIISAQAIQTQ